MLVANSFDLWQKDTFFSAAEEVQQSADIMESAYRTWVREKKEGSRPECLDELSGELQMALSTAKWQLEEFEKAVRLSYKNSADEITVTRHREFVSAIEDQIFRVEDALKASFNMEREQPLRWVTLNEKECDDLAMFLSGTSKASQSSKEESSKLGRPQDRKNSMKDDFSDKVSANAKEDAPNQASCVSDVATRNSDRIHVIEIDAEGTHQTRTNVDCQVDQRVSNRRTWGSPDTNKLQIVIDCNDKERAGDTETLLRDSCAESASWSPKYKYHPQGMQRIITLFLGRRSNWMKKVFEKMAGSERQLQNRSMHRFGFSIPIMLILMLTVFLVVPFVFVHLRSN